MPYTTVQVVQAVVPKLPITATSRPSVSDVTLYIQQRSDEIDAALAYRGFTVPMVGPQWFLDALSRLNAQGAAADVLLGAFMTGEGSDRGSGPVLLKSYEQSIEDIQDGVGIPVGLAETQRNQAPRSYWTDNPVSIVATPEDAVANLSGQTDRYGSPVDPGPLLTRGMNF